MRYLIAAVTASVIFTGCATNPSFNAYEHHEDFTVAQREMTRNITWRVVPNNRVAEICQIKTQGRFAGKRILACAVWQGNQCTVITGTDTDTAVLGHEIRHCYDGDFHD